MYKTIFILLMLSAFSIRADLLPKGKGFIHSQHSFSTSSSLWLRGDEKHPYSGADIFGDGTKARRNYYQAGLSAFYGLGNNFQLGAGIGYGIVHLSDAPILGAAAGDTRSQISNITFEGHYQILKRKSWDLAAGLRYIHPGKVGQRHPEFLSFNDFTSYLELELKHHWKLGLWKIDSLLKYKDTLTEQGNNHLIIEEKFQYSFTNNIISGFGLDYLSTEGGLDVAGVEFGQFFIDQGFLPVWEKNESWLGLSLISSYQFSQVWQIDGYIHRKIIGKNTDIATTIGFGLGRGF
jgi:hypothetical protein